MGTTKFGDLHVELKFKPRSLWMGVYWKRVYGHCWSRLYVFIGPLPMIQLRLTKSREEAPY